VRRLKEILGAISRMRHSRRIATDDVKVCSGTKSGFGVPLNLSNKKNISRIWNNFMSKITFYFVLLIFRFLFKLVKTVDQGEEEDFGLLEGLENMYLLIPDILKLLLR
jgi:hypothetical protein